jgi:hypothetical protein
MIDRWLKAGIIVCLVLTVAFAAMALVAQYTHTAW